MSTSQAATFHNLYGRHYVRVRRLLRCVLGDSHLAEDAAQEVFVKLFAALPRLEARDGDFWPWLSRVARNQGLDELRRRRLVKAVEPATAAALRERRGEMAHPPEPAERVTAAVLLSLGRVSPLQRQVIFLRFVAEMSCADAAAALGCSEGTVRQSQYRALQSLQAALAPGSDGAGGVPRWRAAGAPASV